jgi:hypothetical protein
MAGGMPVLRLMAVVLAGVMILHVLAALFHQFVRTGAADVVRPAPAEVLGSGKIADQNREMPFDD